MITTGGDKHIKDFATVTETLEGLTLSVSFPLYQLMLQLKAIDSTDGQSRSPLENGRGVDLVLWSFKRTRDEPENTFGKIPYPCDSEVLTSTLPIATGDVTPGRSTLSATWKRNCVDGDIRQFH